MNIGCNIKSGDDCLFCLKKRWQKDYLAVTHKGSFYINKDNSHFNPM